MPRGQPLICRPVLLAIAFSASAVCPAAAGEEAEGRYKLGPLGLTPRIELIAAGVDTNVFNEPTNPVPDTTAGVRGSLLGSLPVGRRLRLRGRAYFDARYYYREESERSTGFGGQGEAEIRVGGARLFGDGGGGEMKDRFSIDLDQRLLRQEKWGRIGASLVLGRRLALSGSATDRYFEFGNLIVGGEDIKALLDRNERSVFVDVGFLLTRQTTLTASAEAIEDRFPSETSGRPRRAQSFRYLGGVRLGEKALMSGEALFGVRTFPRGGSGAAPAYRGLAARVSTTLPLPGAWQLQLSADRDVAYASQRANWVSEDLRNTYVLTTVSAETSVPMPFSIVGRIRGSVEQAKYVLPELRQGSAARRLDHRWTAGTSILWPLGDRLLAGLDLLWERRVSNFPDFSYQGLRYGLRGEVLP